MRQSILRALDLLPTEIIENTLGYVLAEEQQPVDLAGGGAQVNAVDRVFTILGCYGFSDRLYSIAFDTYWRVNAVRVQRHLAGFWTVYYPVFGPRLGSCIRHLELDFSVHLRQSKGSKDWHVDSEAMANVGAALEHVALVAKRLYSIVFALDLFFRRSEYTLRKLTPKSVSWIDDSDLVVQIETNVVPALRAADVTIAALKWTCSKAEGVTMGSDQWEMPYAGWNTDQDAVNETAGAAAKMVMEKIGRKVIVRKRRLPPWA